MKYSLAMPEEYHLPMNISQNIGFVKYEFVLRLTGMEPTLERPVVCRCGSTDFIEISDTGSIKIAFCIHCGSQTVYFR